MKNFYRENRLFSLCGLNCGLCPMHIDTYCPGCGGGPGNQTCSIARCSLQHGCVEYCFKCECYPCEKYENVEGFDSFITHRNQIRDLEKAKRMGMIQYQAELEEKIKILEYLLANYNDGRRKSFFCLAVNLLELEDLKLVVGQIEKETEAKKVELKQKASIAIKYFNLMAEERDFILKLNRKKKNYG